MLPRPHVVERCVNDFRRVDARLNVQHVYLRSCLRAFSHAPMLNHFTYIYKIFDRCLCTSCICVTTYLSLHRECTSQRPYARRPSRADVGEAVSLIIIASHLFLLILPYVLSRVSSLQEGYTSTVSARCSIVSVHIYVTSRVSMQEQCT